MPIAPRSTVLLAALAIGGAGLVSARQGYAQSAPPSPSPPALPAPTPSPGQPPPQDPAAEPLGRRIAIAGAGLLGAAWISSVVTAGVLLIADAPGNGGVKPLFIPIAGPFATLSPSHAQGASAVLLVVDGVAQAAGLVMVIAGAVADPGTPPTPTKSTLKATPLLQPEIRLGGRSGALRWRF